MKFTTCPLPYCILTLTIALIFCVGCGEDEPLDAVEAEESTTLLVPELRIETTTLEVASEGDSQRRLGRLPSEDTQMITNAGTPTTVYVVMDGKLTKREIVFQEEIYHLLWCYLDIYPVLVNVLENQIPYISDEEDREQREKRKEEGDRLYAEIEAEVRQGLEGKVILPPEIMDAEIHGRWERAMSTKPFFSLDAQSHLPSTYDEIEVEIKHRFTYKYPSIFGEAEMEMLFVNVLRNITRPHITFPQPPLPQ